LLHRELADKCPRLIAKTFKISDRYVGEDHKRTISIHGIETLPALYSLYSTAPWVRGSPPGALLPRGPPVGPPGALLGPFLLPEALLWSPVCALTGAPSRSSGAPRPALPPPAARPPWQRFFRLEELATSFITRGAYRSLLITFRRSTRSPRV
jgi:hypothetical protein